MTLDTNIKSLIAFLKPINCTHVHGRDMDQADKGTVEQTVALAYASGVRNLTFMSNTSPNISNMKVLNQYLELIYAAEKNHPGMMCHIWVLLNDDNEDDVIEMLQHSRVMGVKIYPLQSDGGGVTTGACGIKNPDSLISLLDRMEDEGIRKTIAGHLEDPDEISQNGHTPAAEEIAVNKFIRIAREYPDNKFIACHISTKSAIEAIQMAHSEGITNIAAEITGHHLWYEHHVGCDCKAEHHCYPPIKDLESRTALREAVFSGGPLIWIASDHAQHTKKQKLNVPREQSPGGIPSLQASLPIAITVLLEHLEEMDMEVSAEVIQDTLNPILSENAHAFLGTTGPDEMVKIDLLPSKQEEYLHDGAVINPFAQEELIGNVIGVYPHF